MPEIDYANAASSAPWFTVASDAEGTGQSITTQRSALNQGVNGVANDLGDQNDDMTTALNAILAAIQARPSA